MIYEVRMTVSFYLQKRETEVDFVGKQVKSTIIEYIYAGDISGAYSKASDLKHTIITDIGKKLNDSCAKIGISLDAVVAKPELNTKNLLKVDAGDVFRTIWIQLRECSKKSADTAMEKILKEFFDAFKDYDTIICEACKRPLRDHTPEEVEPHFNVRCRR